MSKAFYCTFTPPQIKQIKIIGGETGYVQLCCQSMLSNKHTLFHSFTATFIMFYKYRANRTLWTNIIPGTDIKLLFHPVPVVYKHVANFKCQHAPNSKFSWGAYSAPADLSPALGLRALSGGLSVLTLSIPTFYSMASPAIKIQK